MVLTYPMRAPIAWACLMMLSACQTMYMPGPTQPAMLRNAGDASVAIGAFPVHYSVQAAYSPIKNLQVQGNLFRYPRNDMDRFHHRFSIGAGAYILGKAERHYEFQLNAGAGSFRFQDFLALSGRDYVLDRASGSYRDMELTAIYSYVRRWNVRSWMIGISAVDLRYDFSYESDFPGTRLQATFVGIQHVRRWHIGSRFQFFIAPGLGYFVNGAFGKIKHYPVTMRIGFEGRRRTYEPKEQTYYTPHRYGAFGRGW